MKIQRTPYEREAEIDVASELEKLRKHYAVLQQEKQTKHKKAMAKAMNARPSEAQLRLYREGVNKIRALKCEEELDKAKHPTVDAEVMLKTLSIRTQEDERNQQEAPSPYTRPKPTSSRYPAVLQMRNLGQPLYSEDV